jgi:V/A-type H+-transporting ATPase subunit I
MKKATILFETKDTKDSIQHLRRLGVLHIEHQNLPDERGVSGLLEKVALVHSSFDVLNRAMASDRTIQPQIEIISDWTAVATHIIELGKRREELESSSRSVISQISEWEHWGDVDLSKIQDLSQNGIFLKLYQVPVKELQSFPDDVVVKTIFTAGDFAHCVAISRRSFECTHKEVLPPKHSLSLLKEQLAKNSRGLEEIKAEIIRSTCFYKALLRIKERLEKEIEFQQVVSGMGKEGSIGYVAGYVPFDLEGDLIEKAKNRRWGVRINDPSDEDNVPTLLRNPAWVGMIRPVLGLLGLTPGYHELDVSTLFLIFFSIFFGILIGDAGYGLVYILITLLITFYLHKKMQLNPEMKTTVSLFYLLGSCAIIWGVLTGTFFGQGWLSPLVPQLNNATFMQNLCFFLGALHLSIAHSWRALLKFPSLTALADVGWICILWTAFFVARTLVLGESFPPWGIWLIAAGILLVILFTNPQARVLKGIGEGLGTVALSIMNNFTDVISYVRLFAVGLAGLAIAETTNTLAAGFGEGVVALVAGVAILIIGHGLNIILGPISVLVHGVRLNVLEFSGHANVTWNGVAYEPLKE